MSARAASASAGRTHPAGEYVRSQRKYGMQVAAYSPPIDDIRDPGGPATFADKVLDYHIGATRPIVVCRCADVGCTGCAYHAARIPRPTLNSAVIIVRSLRTQARDWVVEIEE